MDEFASRHYPVHEDMRFQKRSWLVERVGWIVLTAIAVAGLTGLGGNGPASWAHASAGPLSVSYERFQRATRTAAFVFDLTPASNESTLHLDPPFQRNFEYTSIQPAPVRSRIGPNGIDFTFAAAQGGPGRVVIWAQARHYGLSTVKAATDGGASASFWIFVYP